MDSQDNSNFFPDLQSRGQESWRKPKSIDHAPAIFREQLNEKEQKMFMKLEENHVHHYKEIFDIFDIDGDGQI